MLTSYYEVSKALHIISIIIWSIGQIIIPYVYYHHASVQHESEADKILIRFESNLLYYCVNPAMICVFIFGLINTYYYGILALGIWFHIKIFTVALLSIIHGLLIKWHKAFVEGKNLHSSEFYLGVSRIAGLLIALAVLMVVLKPFE